jgi:hypothetical protein
MNRAIVLTLSVCLCAAPAAAAVPLVISHQGQLHDTSDNPVNGQRDFKFRIYAKAKANGQFQMLWEEPHAAVEVYNGFYTVDLGSDTPLDEGLLDPTDPLFFPERELALVVGSDAEMNPRLKFGSVVYAIRAGNAELLGGEDSDFYAKAADLAAAAVLAESSYFKKAGGSVAGNLSVSGTTALSAMTAESAGFSGSVTAQTVTATGTVGAATVNATGELQVGGQNTDKRYARAYQHVLNVTTGKLRPLSRFAPSTPAAGASEGTVSVGVQVQSKTAAHSGTSQYLFQGGYAQLPAGSGNTYPGPWAKLYPLDAGRGHGDSTGGFDVYVRAGTGPLDYDFAVGANAHDKALVVTFSDEAGGDLTRTDLSSAPEETIPATPGVAFSHRSLQVENSVAIGLNAPAYNLSVRGPTGTSSQISLSSDDNNFINLYTNASDDAAIAYDDSKALRFGTWTSSAASGWSEKARLSSTGDFGVGKTPTARLDVAGNARIGSSATENIIALNGTAGDAGYNTSVIANRVYAGTNNDQTELVLFQGNDFDGCATCNDRIRIDTPGSIIFQTSTAARTYPTEGTTRLTINSTGDAAFTENVSVAKNLTVGGNVTYGSLKDWRLVFRDDFEANATGWSMTTRTACAGSNILGGVGNTSTSFNKNFDLTGIAHTDVKVVLDYYSVDSWDSPQGEVGWVSVSGSNVNRVWRSPVINYDQQGRANACGLASYAEGVYNVTLTGTHSGNTVTVTAGATLDSPGTDESFGVDNVEVWVR